MKKKVKKVAENISQVSFINRLTIRLSQSERLLLAKYLSVLLLSGLAIDDAIEILLQQAKGPLKKVLQTLLAVCQLNHVVYVGHVQIQAVKY